MDCDWASRLEDNFIFHASLEYNVSGKSQFSISKDLAIKFILMKIISFNDTLQIPCWWKCCRYIMLERLISSQKRPLNIHLITAKKLLSIKVSIKFSTRNRIPFYLRAEKMSELCLNCFFSPCHETGQRLAALMVQQLLSARNPLRANVFYDKQI